MALDFLASTTGHELALGLLTAVFPSDWRLRLGPLLLGQDWECKPDRGINQC